MKSSKPGRKPANKPRRHIVFEPDIDAAIEGLMASKDRERSWIVNYYVRRGMETEKTA